METENKIKYFNANLTKALTQSEVEACRKEYGYFEVSEKKLNFLLKFLLKFRGLTALMLELIVIFSWFLHKHADAYILLGVLLFNAIIGFIQEHNATNTVEALKEKLQIKIKLLRGGAWITLTARELVPGNIIRIRKGDFVTVRQKNHFWKSVSCKTLLIIISGDIILGILFSTSGLMGFKAIPLMQTFVVISYTAVFSFILNDLIKYTLLKYWGKIIKQ